MPCYKAGILLLSLVLEKWDSFFHFCCETPAKAELTSAVIWLPVTLDEWKQLRTKERQEDSKSTAKMCSEMLKSYNIPVIFYFTQLLAPLFLQFNLTCNFILCLSLLIHILCFYRIFLLWSSLLLIYTMYISVHNQFEASNRKSITFETNNQ